MPTRVTRSDGVYFEISYPFEVTTNGGPAEKKAAKLYSQIYQQRLELGLDDIHSQTNHEDRLASIIADIEGDSIDDSKAARFDPGRTY